MGLSAAGSRTVLRRSRIGNGPLRQRRRGAAERRAQQLVLAPVAQPARAGPPVALLGRPADRSPQRVNFAFGGAQVGLVRDVSQDLAGPEVHQLQHPGPRPTNPPQPQCVELHLEQRLGLEADPWGHAGLVVHYPHRTVGGHVETVDITAQQQAIIEHGLHVELALGRLEPTRIFELEVPLEQFGGALEPGHLDGAVGIIGKEARQLRLGLAQLLPGRADQLGGARRDAIARGQVEQRIQDVVQQCAPCCDRAWPLRQPVDDPEPVEQRAGHEIARPRWRQGADRCGDRGCDGLRTRHDATIRQRADRIGVITRACIHGVAHSIEGVSDESRGNPADGGANPPEQPDGIGPALGPSGSSGTGGPGQSGPDRDGQSGSPTANPGLRLGAPFGIPIFLAPSSLVLALLLAYVFGPAAAREIPGLGGAAFLVGLAFAAMLYGSVLLHELAHSVVARSFGIPVRRIVLQLLGGVSELEREPETAGRELLVAIAGPALSLVLAAAGIGLGRLLPEESLIRWLVLGIGGANLLVGLFNLLPGLPRDGGRVLRAVAWAITGKPLLSTLIAAWAGRVVAVLVAALPFLVAAPGGGPASVSDVVGCNMIARR